MALTYSEIFEERGSLYHRAMLEHPEARSAEFSGLFATRPLERGERVLDVPAGGGYLAQHVPAGVVVDGYELTEGFGAGIALFDPSTNGVGEFDRAVCLAALHHIDDRRAFLKALASHVKPGGLLHVADVMHGSPLAEFLDGFVGRYNATGHQGMYIDARDSTWPEVGTVLRAEERDCPWRFPDMASLLGFASGLFGLVDCPPDELRDAMDRHVGITREAGAVLLQWRLLYVDIRL